MKTVNNWRFQIACIYIDPFADEYDIALRDQNILIKTSG